MSPITAMFLILAAFFSTPTRASSISPQCRFDPDGYFYLKSGAQGFEDFDYIQLQIKDQSYLTGKSGKSYKFAKLGEFQTHSSGSGITFEFTTEIVERVNYQFSGKFVAICVLADDEPDAERVVARGKLLKFEKGKQKAAADVELTYAKSPQPQKSNDGSKPADGAGRHVLAIVNKMELKAYTDDLGNGKVLVSDIVRFEVVEPTELKWVSVTAYYQGAPNVGGRRLQVGDLVRFELPPEVQRAGVLLQDLKGLRLRE